MPSNFPLENWSTQPSQNDRTGAPFVEGQTSESLNNGGRDMMAAIREQWVDAQWFSYGNITENPTEGHDIAWNSSDSFRVIGGDFRSIYHIGRRVRVAGGLTGTIYGTITGTSFATDSIITVTFDSGSLVNELLTVWIGIIGAQNSSFKVFDRLTRLLFPMALPPSGWDIVTGIGGRAVITNNTSGGDLVGSDWVIDDLTHPHNHPFTTGAAQGSTRPAGTGNPVPDPNHFHSGTTGPPDSDAIISAGTWRPAHITVVLAEYNP